MVFFLLFLYKIVFEDFLPLRAYNDVFPKENLMFYFLNNRQKKSWISHVDCFGGHLVL